MSEGRVPRNLSLFLKDKFGLKVFVETGTYEGKSSKWAAAHFDKVYTIELHQPYFEKVSNKYSHIGNIDFLLGDSRVELKNILARLEEPALFWLDAHWSGGSAQAAYQREDECPLIEELEAIVSSNLNHFIIVDDARLFLNPPKKPHHPDQWPAYQKIKDLLSGWCCRVEKDRIIAVPEKDAEKVWEFIKNNDIIREN